MTSQPVPSQSKSCNLKFSNLNICRLHFNPRKETAGQTNLHLPLGDKAHLFLGQVQQLFLGFLHILGWAPDGHSVTARALGGEVDVDSTTLLHDGADEAAFGANEGIVQFGRNRHLHLCDVGLREDNTRLLVKMQKPVCTHSAPPPAPPLLGALQSCV